MVGAWSKRSIFYIKCLVIKNQTQQSHGRQTSLYQMRMKGKEQGEQVTILY
jgi:hypothetical protein